MPVMDLLDRAQMSAVWDILPIRHRKKLAIEAAPEWAESFISNWGLELAVAKPWREIPNRVRQYIVFYLNARATVLEHQDHSMVQQ